MGDSGDVQGDSKELTLVELTLALILFDPLIIPIRHSSFAPRGPEDNPKGIGHIVTQ